MKRLIVILLLLAVWRGHAATMKFSDYPNTSTISNTWLFLLARPGVTNYNITYAQLTNLLWADINATSNILKTATINATNDLKSYVDTSLDGKVNTNETRNITSSGYARHAGVSAWTNGVAGTGVTNNPDGTVSANTITVSGNRVTRTGDTLTGDVSATIESDGSTATTIASTFATDSEVTTATDARVNTNETRNVASSGYARHAGVSAWTNGTAGVGITNNPDGTMTTSGNVIIGGDLNVDAVNATSGITADSVAATTIYASDTGTGFYGDGGGLSNAVTLTAGANITITPGPGLRAFEISAAGAAAAPFTNAAIAYGGYLGAATNVLEISGLGVTIHNGLGDVTLISTNGQSIFSNDVRTASGLRDTGNIERLQWGTTTKVNNNAGNTILEGQSSAAAPTTLTGGAGAAALVLDNNGNIGVTGTIVGYAKTNHTGPVDFGGASSLEIKNAAGTSTLAEGGQVAYNTTDKLLGIHNGTKEVAVSTIYHQAWSFDPKAVCDGTIDRLFLISTDISEPKGIHIVKWKLSFEADPTTELDIDLKRADAFIGVANSAVMDVCDTTAGVSSEATSANINGDAVVANGKVIYLEFGTAYSETGHQCIFELFWEVEED